MPESAEWEREEGCSRSPSEMNQGGPSFWTAPHLFMVRVWMEELGNGQTEWRGKVQCVASGDVKYFRDWQTLVTHLEGMLPKH